MEGQLNNTTIEREKGERSSDTKPALTVEVQMHGSLR